MRIFARSVLVLAFVLATEPLTAQDFPWPGGSESERVDITQPDMGNDMSGAVWNPEQNKLWLASKSLVVDRRFFGELF